MDGDNASLSCNMPPFPSPVVSLPHPHLVNNAPRFRNIKATPPYMSRRWQFSRSFRLHDIPSRHFAPERRHPSVKRRVRRFALLACTVVAHASGHKFVMTHALDVGRPSGMFDGRTTNSILNRARGFSRWVASLEMRQEDLVCLGWGGRGEGNVGENAW